MSRLQISGLAEQKHGAAMTSTTHVHPSDFFGFSRLAIDATAGLADLVEAMHHAIARAPGILDRPARGPTGGTAGLVYETVRAVARLVGGETDAVLAPLIAMQGERHSAPEREAVLAALNGVIGDYLAATDNPLAITMRLRRDGQPLTLERGSGRGDSPTKQQADRAGAWPVHE
jgi:hypothetical protein